MNNRIDEICKRILRALDDAYKKIWFEELRMLAQGMPLVDEYDLEKMGEAQIYKILREEYDIDPDVLIHEGSNVLYLHNWSVLAFTVLQPYYDALCAISVGQDNTELEEPISNTPSGIDAMKRESDVWFAFASRIAECYPDLDTTGHYRERTLTLYEISEQVKNWGDTVAKEICNGTHGGYLQDINQLVDRFIRDMSLPRDNPQLSELYEQPGNRMNDVRAVVMTSAYLANLRGEIPKGNTRNWIFSVAINAPSSIPYCEAALNRAVEPLTRTVLKMNWPD